MPRVAYWEPELEHVECFASLGVFGGKLLFASFPSSPISSLMLSTAYEYHVSLFVKRILQVN